MDSNEEWHDIGDGTRMKSVLGGKIIVIAPKDLKQTVVPLFCPLCEFPMITREDGHSYRRMSCCEKCELQWFDSKTLIKEDFELFKTSKEWKDYIDNRRKRSKQLIKLK